MVGAFEYILHLIEKENALQVLLMGAALEDEK